MLILTDPFINRSGPFNLLFVAVAVKTKQPAYFTIEKLLVVALLFEVNKYSDGLVAINFRMLGLRIILLRIGGGHDTTENRSATRRSNAGGAVREKENSSKSSAKFDVRSGMMPNSNPVPNA